MDVKHFDFELPAQRIATRPATPRERARMLVVGSQLQDCTIANVVDYLNAGDVLVVNDTRVLPARLFGKRGNATIEILLHRQTGEIDWLAFAKPAKKLTIHDCITFAEDFSAKVIDKLPSGEILLQFQSDDWRQKLQLHGRMPLPPYIEKLRASDEQDTCDYQTCFAGIEAASVAAPTAGLHFTPALIQQIQAKGITIATVTLHVGAGTFQPMKVENTDQHIMHAEYAVVTAETANIINAAKKAGRRIIAVGTTSLRTLESATDAAGIVKTFAADTRIFITPGYRFKCVDMLLTNFHLPRSTLFMLVCAFSGLETMQSAYAHAIAGNYRFYSYGDACLLTQKIIDNRIELPRF